MALLILLLLLLLLPLVFLFFLASLLVPFICFGAKPKQTHAVFCVSQIQSITKNLLKNLSVRSIDDRSIHNVAFGFCLCNGKMRPIEHKHQQNVDLLCALLCGYIYVESRCILLFIDGLRFILSTVFVRCFLCAHGQCIVCTKESKRTKYKARETQSQTELNSVRCHSYYYCIECIEQCE